jgi:hypothetical protein
MARLSGSEVLNLILILTYYRVVVAIFLGLAAAAELTELPTTEDRTVERGCQDGCGCWNCWIVTGFG